MTPKVKLSVESPPEVAEKVAKAVNEGYRGVSEGTRKKVWELMTRTGDADAKKLVEESDAKKRKAELEQLSEKVLKNHAAVPEKMRHEIHEKILTLLAKDKILDAAGQKYEFEEVEAAIPLFKKPAEAEAKTKADATPEVEVEPQITTADKSVYTGRQVAKAGLVVGSALTAGSLVAGASQAAFGGAALPWYARGISGFTNFWKGAWDIAWHKGVGNVVTNGIWNPLNTLAAKLGVTTGASANTAALAGLPAWMAPIGVGLGVAGGAYAGSKVVNWLGKKVGVKPTTIPIIGKIPFLGPILNSLLTVPPKAAWKGASKVASWGKQGFDWMWGKGKEAAEHREGATHFGIGALAGGTILAGLTGGSSLVLGLLGGHLARKGLKGKHLSDLIPAPFGIKKSEAGGAPAHT